MDPKDRIWLPVDVSSVQEALQLVKTHRDNVGVFKLGLQVLNAALSQVYSYDIPEQVAVNNLVAGRELFLLLQYKYFHDGKWDDIPTTVEGVAVAVQPLHPAYINVHVSAGKKAIAAAVAKKGHAKVLGVTVLTSIDDMEKDSNKKTECMSIFGDNAKNKVLQFARMLRDGGADGIICSAQELEILASDNSLKGLFRAIPGIRPDWEDYAKRLGLPVPEKKADDQSRPLTPGYAILAGADAVIIGRPITKPEVGTSDQIARLIREDISEARRIR